MTAEDIVTQAAADRVVARLKANSSQGNLQDIADKGVAANRNDNKEDTDPTARRDTDTLEFHWDWDKEGKDPKPTAKTPLSGQDGSYGDNQIAELRPDSETKCTGCGLARFFRRSSGQAASP